MTRTVAGFVLAVMVASAHAAAAEASFPALAPGLVDVVRAQSGLLVAGGDGTLRRVDGDALPVVLNAGRRMLGLAASADGTLVAAVGDGVVARSSDGGRTFRLEPLPALVSAYAAAFQGQTLHVFAHDGQAFRATGDGKLARFELPVSAPWWTASFQQGLGAVVGDGALLVTGDGGKTWASRRCPSPAPQGVLVHREALYVTGEGGVFRSTDFGASFERVFLPEGNRAGCMRLAADGPRVAVACAPYDHALALAPDGRHFAEVELPDVANLMAVAFEADGKLAAVGAYELFVRTDDKRGRLVVHSEPVKAWLRIVERRRKELPAKPPSSRDAHRVLVTVREEGGAPVADQKVTLQPTWAVHGEGYQERSTDQTGRVEFASALEGQSHVRIERKGYAPAWQDVRVDGIGPVRCDLTLHPAVKVEGRVVAPGGRLEGGLLRALAPPPEGADLGQYLYRARPAGNAELRSDGTFAFSALAAGDYLLEVTPLGAKPFVARVRAPSSGVELVANPGGRIEGEVRDASGAPVARAEVRVVEGSDLTAHALRFSAYATTDAQGRFAVNGAPPVPLSVEVTPPIRSGQGRLCEHWSAQVAEKQTLALRLQVGTRPSISGVVVDAAGRPVARADVMAEAHPYTSLCDVRVATTDGQGRFELSSVADHEYVLRVVSRTAGHRDSDPLPTETIARPGDRNVRVYVAP